MPDFKYIIATSLTSLWEGVVQFAPRVLAAIAVVVLGWIVAHLFRRFIGAAASRLGLDALSARIGLKGALTRFKIKATPAQLIARLVYWAVMLVTLLVAADTLGLEQLSATIDGIVQYAPNVVASLAVVFIGLAGLSVLRTAAEGLLESVGSESAAVGGRLVYGLGLVVVVGIAVAQLRIETRLFEIVAAIALASAGLAAGLAFGLGAKRQAANVLAGIYARDVYQPGERIQYREHHGHIIEVSTTLTLVELDGGGELRIPNHILSDEAMVTGRPVSDSPTHGDHR